MRGKKSSKSFSVFRRKGWSVRENVTELNVFNLNVWRCEVVPLSKRRSSKQKHPKNFYDKLCHSSSLALQTKASKINWNCENTFCAFRWLKLHFCISIPARKNNKVDEFFHPAFRREERETLNGFCTSNEKNFPTEWNNGSCSARPKVLVTWGHLKLRPSTKGSLISPDAIKLPFSPFSLMWKFFSGLITSEITKCVRAP